MDPAKSTPRLALLCLGGVLAGLLGLGAGWIAKGTVQPPTVAVTLPESAPKPAPAPKVVSELGVNAPGVVGGGGNAPVAATGPTSAESLVDGLEKDFLGNQIRTYPAAGARISLILKQGPEGRRALEALLRRTAGYDFRSGQEPDTTIRWMRAEILKALAKEPDATTRALFNELVNKSPDLREALFAANTFRRGDGMFLLDAQRFRALAVAALDDAAPTPRLRNDQLLSVMVAAAYYGASDLMPQVEAAYVELLAGGVVKRTSYGNVFARMPGPQQEMALARLPADHPLVKEMRADSSTLSRMDLTQSGVQFLLTQKFRQAEGYEDVAKVMDVHIFGRVPWDRWTSLDIGDDNRQGSEPVRPGAVAFLETLAKDPQLPAGVAELAEQKAAALKARGGR